MDALQFGKRGERETGELYWIDQTKLSATVKDVHPELTQFSVAILYCPLTVNVTDPRLLHHQCMVLVDYQDVYIGVENVELRSMMPTPPTAGLLVPVLRAPMKCTPW
jgi:hypothetical protein